MNQLARIRLPATRTELLAQSEPIRPQTLYYGVSEIHLALYEDPDYQQYLNAYTRDQAVEGSIAADEFTAARIIRDYAVEHSMIMVQSATLVDIVRAHRRAMVDGHISRKERRAVAAAMAEAAQMAGNSAQ